MEIKYENQIIFFFQAWMIVGDASQKIEEPRYQGHSGDFGNTAKMVWKISKSVMQLISIRF